MGIDRLSEWMSKFGYGHYTGIDLSEERSGNMPTREWKLKRLRNPGTRVTPFRWASARVTGPPRDPDEQSADDPD
ncbi:penicillin-binding protein 2 (PBP-2) [Klebsiella pneumoniae]|uniref:Penicillin-binding protein 2 (PBP-2) n=1 Tax=Klebsiella pneumoniae TaxID=573 RepID=A0A2X3EPE6_KLEPN|nr:penicillin-binding protein 2 (PBP-2) [Klebsiella pneumoniae]